MKISASDWAVISAHFDRLVELSPEQRQSELAALDLGEGHRRQLEHLLDQHHRAESLGLDTGAPQRLGLDPPDDPDSTPPPPDWEGERLGPWLVDEVIGRGGMSVIYRGHRADGRFEKRVAIKVLNRANLFADSARLDEEVRILARLEHAGIARLIDSGTSAAGHSYLVMELISGQPLDAWCREHSLATIARVELIIAAAQALEYAHQRQVVHCDIKPANLLVRNDGGLCVVDFGIAALLQRHPASSGHLYCSPAYTAPERLRRAPPDTRQDVYALGAVLRELVDARDRDLKAICSCATAGDPDQRYASMTTFLSELQAWLDNRPVQARGGGQLYVLERWLRRHALAAMLGVLLVVSLASGAGISLWQAREATREAERAIAARDFLIGIFEAADPALSRGEDPPASELLRRGAEQLDASMAAQPRLLAEMLHVIGRTQLERGLIDDAIESLDRVLALTQKHGMHSLYTLALSDRGMAAYEQGNYGQAIDWLERARSLAVGNPTAATHRDRVEVRLADMLVVNRQAERALAVIEPLLERLGDVRNGPSASIRVDAQRVLGAALQEDNELDRAQRVLETALELQQALDDDDILLAKIEHDLGIVHWYQQDLDAAAGVFARALAHKRAVYGDDHPQTLSTLGNLAGVSMARGDHSGAESAWQKSLAALERIHRSPHPDIAYTWGMLAWSSYLSGDFEHALGRIERAIAHSLKLDEKTLPELVWLQPLRGLLRFELDRPGALADLRHGARPCRDLTEHSSLEQRFCLAQGLLETDQLDAPCAESDTGAASSDLLNAQPLRWRLAHAVIEARCSRSGDLPAWPADAGTPPPWLEVRLGSL